MNISVNEHFQLEIKEVYEPIILLGSDEEAISICQRDGGFEFYYVGNHYSVKDGVVKKMNPPHSLQGNTI